MAPQVPLAFTERARGPLQQFLKMLVYIIEAHSTRRLQPMSVYDSIGAWNESFDELRSHTNCTSKDKDFPSAAPRSLLSLNEMLYRDYNPLLIMSAAFSATPTTIAAGWPLSCEGNTLASHILRPFTPCTRNIGSTTPVSGVGEILQVDVCHHRRKS